MHGFQQLPQDILHLLEMLGPWGVLAFIPIYLIASFLLIPGPLLGMAAGAVYGIPEGFAVLSFSSLLSAGIAFLAGRYWSRKWAFEKIASNHKIKALDDAVTRNGWKMVALLRLTAILPFSLMNYVLGLSKIRFRDYLLASWIGMMPGLFLYIYLGSLAGEMVFQKTARQKTAAEWALFAVAILMTLGMSVYATRVVHGAMNTPKE